MSVQKILQYPDPLLKKKSTAVNDFGKDTQAIIDDVVDTMYADSNSAGLAAPQIGVHQRIIAIDFSPKRDQLLILINPEVLEESTETTREPEACLSVPFGVYESVVRTKRIKIRAQDRVGKSFEIDDDTFLAKCIQHELDHLEGILFIDHLSRFKRARIDQKIKKLSKK